MPQNMIRSTRTCHDQLLPSLASIPLQNSMKKKKKNRIERHYKMRFASQSLMLTRESLDRSMMIFGILRHFDHHHAFSCVSSLCLNGSYLRNMMYFTRQVKRLEKVKLGCRTRY